MTESVAQPRYTLQEAAQAIGMGERAVFRALRRRRVITKANVPVVRYKRLGYLVEEEHSYQHPSVGTKFYSRTLVTPAGIQWLQTLLADDQASKPCPMHALVQEIAHMNPDAAEIGPGKLSHLVSQARAIIASEASQ
ncbi:MAG: phage antirepressor KilAC domain-containing protein [Salinisphaera sp.]|jgi:hypothetical protein|nr:phage antirepressor KilAC domain-containing protein [Salinisphaera sp.]